VWVTLFLEAYMNKIVPTKFKMLEPGLSLSTCLLSNSVLSDQIMISLSHVWCYNPEISKKVHLHIKSAAGIGERWDWNFCSLSVEQRQKISLYHLHFVPYWFYFHHSSWKWIRLHEQNDSKQSLTTLFQLYIV